LKIKCFRIELTNGQTKNKPDKSVEECTVVREAKQVTAMVQLHEGL